MSLRTPARTARLALLAALGAALALPGAAVASGWRAPVAGRVAGAFAYDGGAPFAAGARRGIDLVAPPESPVLAACTGVVTWSGWLPGRASRGVAIRCGGLVATELGLAAVLTREGTRVRAGSPLGTLAAAGRLRLGARRAGSRWGYVDPARLIAGGADRPPPAVAPGPRPNGRPAAGPPRPDAVPHAAPRGAPSTSPGVPAAPGVAAVAGLVLLAASVVRQRCPSTSRRRSTTSTRLRTWGTPTRRSRPT